MRDGLRSDCKVCNLATRKQWYAENRAREIARVKQWQQDNKDRVNQKHREYREARPEAIREGHLRRRFGLTLESYAQLLAAQGGGCAICGDPEPEGGSHHVDHDHETDAVRGILCVRCNNALGQLREDVDLVARAMDYLGSNGFAPSGAYEMIELARERAGSLCGVAE